MTFFKCKIILSYADDTNVLYLNKHTDERQGLADDILSNAVIWFN